MFSWKYKYTSPLEQFYKIVPTDQYKTIEIPVAPFTNVV